MIAKSSPLASRQARREFVARVLVVRRAGGIELGKTLGLARSGRVRYRGVRPRDHGVPHAGADAAPAEPSSP
eukprot:15463714-Alexandrium_andersonii.AAC.1